MAVAKETAGNRSDVPASTFGPTKRTADSECKLINHELTAHNMKMMVPEQKSVLGGTHVASDFNVLTDSLKEKVDAIHADTRAKLPSMGGGPPLSEIKKEGDETEDDDDDEDIEIVNVEEMRRKASGAISK